MGLWGNVEANSVIREESLYYNLLLLVVRLHKTEDVESGRSTLDPLGIARASATNCEVARKCFGMCHVQSFTSSCLERLGVACGKLLGGD